MSKLYYSACVLNVPCFSLTQARVVRAAPNDEVTIQMRAIVLSGLCSGAWEVGPRSATELRLAALHYERCAELSPATAWKAKLAGYAEWCLRQAPCKL